MHIDFNKIKCYFNFIKRGVINMSVEIMPIWLSNLDEEDVAFIKRFVLSSGSLKEMAKQ